jgi:hypothetical protein
MLRIYGKMTHIIFYADRTITIGFALGWATSPCRSSASRFTSCATASVLVGKLDPTYNIRMMGIPCCSFCPGIGDYHTGELRASARRVRREQGQAEGKRFLERKKKLNDGKPNMPNQKEAGAARQAGRHARGVARHPQGE